MNVEAYASGGRIEYAAFAEAVARVIETVAGRQKDYRSRPRACPATPATQTARPGWRQ